MTATPPMPEGLVQTRSTPVFTESTMPAGLRSAHRVAGGNWGRLQVIEGSATFIFETDPPSRHDLGPGDHIDIPPDVPHRVEPHPDVRLFVEFFRLDPPA